MSNSRKPYQLVSYEWKKEPTLIQMGDEWIGGKHFTMIAGPCAVETEEQTYSIARYLSGKGVRFLRGGAYKPRTSPYAFQGLKEEGLKFLRGAADQHQMYVVTEVMDTHLIDTVAQYADILQVGTRNMHNYQLLKGLSKVDKPILLKRGWCSTIEEWLLAAEYLLLGGNHKVILCERGIRTFENQTRNTLDLNAVALAKQLSHLPVIVDPSQGTGHRDLVNSMGLAALAAGADGLMIEVHHQPEEALSDGAQSLYFDQFDDLVIKLGKMAKVVDKEYVMAKTEVNITP
jgi:3-deoxy-7-phosphoheptulonate synthase